MTEVLKRSSNRSFGIVFFVFFFFVGVYFYNEKNEINFLFFFISLTFLFLGMKNSSILTPLNILWTKFGLLLSKIVSPIVLGIIFFGIVTPTSIIMKLLGKDLLKLKKNKSKTYWVDAINYKNSMKDQF